MGSNDHVPLGHLDDKEIQFITPGLTYVNGVPQSSKLPALEDMSSLSNSDLLQVLNHFKVFEPWPSFVNDSMAYIVRTTNYAPGSPSFKKAVSDLVDMSSKKALTGMSRRISENWSTLEAIEGNVDREMIWLTLDDSATCPACNDNDGVVKPYSQWLQSGLPGAQTCDGGSACRCSLILVSDD